MHVIFKIKNSKCAHQFRRIFIKNQKSFHNSILKKMVNRYILKEIRN